MDLLEFLVFGITASVVCLRQAWISLQSRSGLRPVAPFNRRLHQRAPGSLPHPANDTWKVRKAA
jgi:hypothetical protein